MPMNAQGHDHDAVARLLHALADPSRLALVHLLTGVERRVVDLTRELGLAQSTVSAHLTMLRDAGVVAVRREGRTTEWKCPQCKTVLVTLDQHGNPRRHSPWDDALE